MSINTAGSQVQESENHLFKKRSSSLVRVYITREVAEKALRICYEEKFSIGSLSRCVEAIIVAYEKLRQVAHLLTLFQL